MSSFHILMKRTGCYRDKGMKYKIWIWLITAVTAFVIIRYYVTGNYSIEEKREEEIQIRVLIKSSNFETIFHEQPVISCSCDFLVEEENGEKRLSAGECYQLKNGKKAILTSLGEEGLVICGLERRQEEPVYAGKLELVQKEDGIVVINELPLEEYLPKVLSSEMSSAFPMEALKAQAVCARTYALKKKEENKSSYYGADLDDSVSYQVYNNEKDSSIMHEAVHATKGMVMMDMHDEENRLSDIYYYSTSCGITPDDVFKTEEKFEEFITSVRIDDREKEESWYRWQAEISLERIKENLLTMGYDVLETPRKFQVIKRKENGQAEQLQIDFSDGKTEIVEGEYNIRKVLAPEDGKLVLQDGRNCDGLGMLPSGWFVFQENANAEILIQGGGYGHGVGLSQNGARIMAEQGMEYQEILAFYYPEQQIIKMTEEG